MKKFLISILENIMLFAIRIIPKLVLTVVISAGMAFINCALLMVLFYAVDMTKEAYQFWGVCTAIIAVPTLLCVIGSEIIEMIRA